MQLQAWPIDAGEGRGARGPVRQIIRESINVIFHVKSLLADVDDYCIDMF